MLKRLGTNSGNSSFSRDSIVSGVYDILYKPCARATPTHVPVDNRLALILELTHLSSRKPVMLYECYKLVR